MMDWGQLTARNRSDNNLPRLYSRHGASIGLQRRRLPTLVMGWSHSSNGKGAYSSNGFGPVDRPESVGQQLAPFIFQARG